MTDFEKSVKIRLAELGKNQKWLAEEVRKVYDGVVNAPVITNAIKGSNKVYPQVKIAIAKVLHIQF